MGSRYLGATLGKLREPQGVVGSIREPWVTYPPFEPQTLNPKPKTLNPKP